MTLQDQLDAFRERFESGELPRKPTQAQLDTMRRATADLIESGLADRALKAGEVAPDFKLEGADGNAVSSQELLANGPLIVSFYRGVWCPYCNIDLKALEATRPEFESRGAQLVAISPQTPSNSRKSRRDNGLNFPILSDKGSKVAAAFGVRFALPSDLVNLYKTFGNDLPTINDDPSWVLPMPARYVIGGDRVVAYAEVNPDYTRRPDPSILLPVLERLNSSVLA
ncbi:peroxiredoxin-like family protein [Gellertiella hungarica]|uniref:thioredoxin-dependent peroxiredoxin n=1 Tax=Gellertiella hungarica TaxID=1572859 RepID=A0A7W6J7P1_9HYPH|nr:peroxiredoxin-like family protein [Gellertiella hungarica]MBB4066341.1 peroxiredoxin [Gellertiella hungarica]